MAVLASQIAVMMEVQFKSGIHSDRIAAIGISNQRETTVVWDRVSGQPIYNAIVWQCRRTASLIDNLVEQGAEEGLPFVRYVTYLDEKGYIPPNGKKWVDYIRTSGNVANHEIVIKEREETQKVITFLSTLLLVIYELPNSLEA